MKNKLSRSDTIIGNIISIVTLSIVFGALLTSMILNLFASVFSAIIMLLIYIHCKDLYRSALYGKTYQI